MKVTRAGDKECEGTLLFREATKGMSRAEVARRLDVNRSQVIDWLDAHRRPSGEHATTIQSVFGIPATAWFAAPTAPASGTTLPADAEDPQRASSNK